MAKLSAIRLRGGCFFANFAQMKQELWPRATWLVAFLLLVACPGGVAAQSFLTTRTVTLKQSAWNASVEFPTSGDEAVVEGVLRWIADVLEIEYRRRADFASQLQASCDSFMAERQSFTRSVVVERSYEDGGCVTFEALVTDSGNEKWRWADCASFSKRDGHRIRIDEIFNCDTSDICRLMWEYRGDLALDADGPEDLVPANAGFVDGWVVVIGPALNYTGAPFRLRYEDILPYLRTSENGYFTW